MEEEHRAVRIPFSAERVYAYDIMLNVVGSKETRQYMGRFDLDKGRVRLEPAGDRAAWNPPPGMVAIYGAMLSCDVTLPLQPFITWFLAEAQISPA